MKKIVFISNVDTGKGMSGGTRIYVEFLKNLDTSFRTFFFGSAGTNQYLRQKKIKNITYFETDTNDSSNLFSMGGVFVHYIRRILRGINSLRKNKAIITHADYVYSVSDFFPDIIPALYAKFLNPKIKWIAAFYFFAANPFSSNFPYKGLLLRFRGALYFFSQKIAYWLIIKYSDFIVLCNEIDKAVFEKSKYLASHIYTIYGGIDLNEADAVSNPLRKKYDGVFMARFHPQKGPLVAVKTWEEVIKSKPNALLAMIGEGSMGKEIKAYIKNKKLGKNIFLLGFMDGKEKYKVLKSAKVFLHTAIYETGGMAAAEGMAAGLPVIAFDHSGFDYCYPKGMLRIAPIGDTKKMASAILNLLTDLQMYNRLKQQAVDLVREEWDWRKRFAQLYAKMDIAFKN